MHCGCQFLKQSMGHVSDLLKLLLYRFTKWYLLPISWHEVVLVFHIVKRSGAFWPYRDTKLCLLPIPCYEVMHVAHIVTRSGACRPYRDTKWCMLPISWHEVIHVAHIVTRSGACRPHRDTEVVLVAHVVARSIANQFSFNTTDLRCTKS
jgi:hypothetical protein